MMLHRFRRPTWRHVSSWRRFASAPAIACHGGAWAIPDNIRQASLEGASAAAAAGWSLLASGGSALDAVEIAVRSLEEDPVFDAGRGAVLNAAGEVELDAVIMDGRDLSAGAVAAMGPCLHPVSVARLVMERTPHVLLVGAGATAFAREHGIEILPVDALVTPEARAEYERMASFPTSVSSLFNTHEHAPSGHDTVGAVAIDEHGNLAAATSTGGITFKRVGRVGDSPILGSGCLADNEVGAISTTGHGESILRVQLASRAIHAMASGLTAREATAGALETMLLRVGGCGGAVSVDRSGQVAVAFSTPRMAWAVRSTATGRVQCGIDRSEAALATSSSAKGQLVGSKATIPKALRVELVDLEEVTSF
jgi:beta-aspartyl-peptidase (threonine type)